VIITTLMAIIAGGFSVSDLQKWYTYIRMGLKLV
jgi:hypothetical protein